MLEISSGQRLAPASADVVARVVDGEAIIINLASGLYYSTRGAGAVIWQGIEANQSLGEVVSSVCASFDAPPAVAEKDVRTLIGALVSEDLVRVDGIAAAATAAQAPAEDGRTAYLSPELVKFTDMAQFLALDPPLPSLEF